LESNHAIQPDSRRIEVFRLGLDLTIPGSALMAALWVALLRFL
jgi:hypothetical protein